MTPRWLKWLIQGFKLPHLREPLDVKLPTERSYEWRDEANGRQYGIKELAPNACIFRLRSLKTGKVIVAKIDAPPDKVLNIYVSNTEEKVITNMKDNVCWLHNEDTPRFKI